MLGISVLLFLAASAVMPPGYSFVRNTISESAAQGVPRAWIGRVGFVTFGLGVLLSCLTCRASWNPASSLLLAAFGMLMLLAAFAATRPWVSGQEFDEREARCHSVAASAAGVAYALGLAVLLIVSRSGSRGMWLLTAVALVSGAVVPLAMMARPNWAGILQRTMFAISYLWFASEVLQV